MAQPIWNTSAGSVGIYPSTIAFTYQLSASAVSPATSITYTLISGSLPDNVSMDSAGLISGTPNLVTEETSYPFVVRATDDLGNIRDRTFTLSVSGTAAPSITTAAGTILETLDSIWTSLQIGYNNPKTDNPVVFSVIQGALPPGLEINSDGLIRGYPNPPILNVALPLVTDVATQTSDDDYVTCLSTIDFTAGRQIIFSGTEIGGITAGQTYYIKQILSPTTFTISNTQNGPVVNLNSDTGYMTITLPATSVGEPTKRTYSFTIRLESPLGNDTAAYSIVVINQNTPISQGGPGYPANTRTPTIYNTRPPSFYINDSNPYYGYYIADINVVPAEIGTFENDNYLAFKIIGHDFDSNGLTYSFSGLPSFMTGDPDTGWITGTPNLITDGVAPYTFSVAVYKTDNPAIISDYFQFTFNVYKTITGVITWISPSNLGTIYNGSLSTQVILAECDTDLEYSLSSGSLPPNLVLLSSGELSGYIADQPTSSLLNLGDTTTFTFTVEAYSPLYATVTSTKEFTLTVLQEFDQPTDTLYIKATPSIADRLLLDSLLTDTSLIPTSYLYRPDDPYFGKATNVTYEHAYGIYASNIDQYLAAVTRNHYWRNITLGELATAIARDENGDIIYEVVYSKVIDNLINPEGISINSHIYWPRPIDLYMGPWYTSVTDIYTSYADVLDQQYYTSLTPGYARNLYPNSLPNMRNRVADVLGQELNSKLLPLWMTSQQENGSTLGFTPAWVICYTKPGYSSIIKNNIETNWTDANNNVIMLNQIDFQIDRFSVDKSLTYDYDTSVDPNVWTSLPSATPTPYPLDSQDFYVLFPQKTILPNETQY